MDESELQHRASASSDLVDRAPTSWVARPDGTETSWHAGELKDASGRVSMEAMQEERGQTPAESRYETERNDSSLGDAAATPSQERGGMAEERRGLGHNVQDTKENGAGIERLVSGDLDVLMAMKTLEAVEKDAETVAGSFSSLLTSLQAALSEVTMSSVDHMQCYCEVAGQVQDAALDAAAKGNRFINACLRLNEEMKGMDSLATQLKTLRQTVDRFEYQTSRFLPRT